MALHLTSKNLLRRAAHILESGPARTTAISAISGTVGLVAGKREDARVVPLVAVGAGAALKLVGLHTLGDGAMAGGATILGYKFGAKMGRGRQPVASVIPGTPTVRRRRG